MRSATWCGRILAPFVMALGAAAMLPDAASAQKMEYSLDPLTAGTTYVIAFPDTTANAQDVRFPTNRKEAFQLFVYSTDEDTRVTVTLPDNSTLVKTLTAGEFTTFDLNVRPVVTNRNIVSDNVFLVESRDPILVYCYMTTKHGTEAWSPLPVEAWGRSYYAAAMPGEVVKNVMPGSEFNFETNNQEAPAEILVIAAHDDTEVKISARGDLIGSSNDPARSRTVTLDANQAYLVQSYVDTLPQYGNGQADIGGSYITADKPISVVTGNTRSMVIPGEGLTANSFKGMLVEALAPVDQHGTEFAYLPNWDRNRRTGDPKEASGHKRPGEIIRVYGTSGGTTNGTFSNGEEKPTDFTVDNGGTFSQRFDITTARVFRTDQPAQVMMNTAATVKFNGTTVYWGSYVGTSFEGWAGSMVEMTPREQWVDFAPFFVPGQPNNMEHYVNVVTDSANLGNVFYKMGSVNEGAEQRFIFNRGAIEGTDLVWGTMSLVPDQTYYLVGRDGAKVGAYVYGSVAGYELYRPGITKKDGKDDGAVSQSGEKRGARLFHPSEYEENISCAYAYPVSPSRRTLATADDLKVDVKKEGSEYRVKIESISTGNAGIRSIELTEGSVNAQIRHIDPVRKIDVAGSANAVVDVVPVDPMSPVTATLVVTDRTGATREVPVTTVVSSVDAPETGTARYSLGRNEPNPFTGRTTIPFTIAVPAKVTVTVYNSVGRKVAVLIDETLPAGPHNVTWESTGHPAGPYYYELTCDGHTSTRTMIAQ